MNKLFKRLLSLTIIAVMVFAMIPAVSAVEMNASKTYDITQAYSNGTIVAGQTVIGDYTVLYTGAGALLTRENTTTGNFYIQNNGFYGTANRSLAFKFALSEEIPLNTSVPITFNGIKTGVNVFILKYDSSVDYTQNIYATLGTGAEGYVGTNTGTSSTFTGEACFDSYGDYVLVLRSTGANSSGGNLQFYEMTLRYHAHTFGAETMIKAASIFNGTITSKTCTDETCGETVITEADDKVAAPDGAVVCMDATNYYTSFAALAEADAVSGVYGLISDDYTETLCYVPAGVTLDLMGNNLTAKAIIAEGEIRDSIGGGKLNADSVVLKGQDGYIPVNTGSGYEFYTANLTQTQIDGDVYAFLPAFDADLEAALANGATALGLKIAVRVSYTTASGLTSYTDFVYSDELVKQVYDGTGENAFSLTITNASSYTNIAYSVMIVSENAMATITG